MTTEENKALTARIAALTGKRFCSTCQMEAPADTGTQLNRRWVCGWCMEKRRLRSGRSIYLTPKVE